MHSDFIIALYISMQYRLRCPPLFNKFEFFQYLRLSTGYVEILPFRQKRLFSSQSINYIHNQKEISIYYYLTVCLRLHSGYECTDEQV